MANLEPQSRAIAADPRRLRQTLVNLPESAVQFTPACGALGWQVTASKAQAHGEDGAGLNGLGSLAQE